MHGPPALVSKMKESSEVVVWKNMEFTWMRFPRALSGFPVAGDMLVTLGNATLFISGSRNT